MAAKGKRTRNLFEPGSAEPYRLSRSKLALFIECPRCFYLDRRLGIGRPPGPPFSLNSAVDALLKKEFDLHREQGTIHPCMKENGIDAVPFKHEKLEEWRDSLHRGITYPVPKTNLVLTGGVDDIWVRRNGELIIVDYKATSKQGEVNIDAEWQDGYKRQIEFYQWLFRRNGFKVSDTGYFVYCNGDAGKEHFDCKLEFTIKVIPYRGSDSWIEGAVKQAWRCLNSDVMPDAEPTCEFCAYRREAQLVEAKSEITVA